MPEDAPGNPGAVRPAEQPAVKQVAQYRKVREMQAKLHRWAGDDRSCRFGDLFNLVSDLDFLAEGWLRVKANTGSRTPGIDGATVADIENRIGVGVFLGQIRDSLKAGGFRPVPVRQVIIPKKSGKLRKLGIPTIADRVVQAALKLVLEPMRWLRSKHSRLGMPALRRRFCVRGTWKFAANGPRGHPSRSWHHANPSGQDTWSARCGESRTPGAAGGSGKPTRSNPGRAPRSDPTNTHRPHRALQQAAPLRQLPDAITDPDQFRVQRRDRAGGVIHEYRLVA